jgi:hypothetical protein
MKILDLDQNSEEWLEFRKGKSGGSAFGKMYKVDGRTNHKLGDQFFVMLAERVARPMTPNDYYDRVPEGVPFSWAVRGHILEPDAAKAFALKYNKPLSDGKVWTDDKNLASYVSPDRVIISPDGKIREAVEIKCLSSEKVLKIWWGKMNQKEGESDFWIIPTNEYRAQALKYFMINEDLDKLYWVVYTDLIPKLELQVLEINRGEITDWLEDAKEVEKEYLEELEKAEKMLD